MYKATLVAFLALVFLSQAEMPKPVKEADHYKIYKRSDIDLSSRKFPSERRERLEANGRIVELPTDHNIPPDDGGNYGDLLFDDTERGRLLVARETIENDWYDYDIAIYYNRTFDGYVLSDMNVLNFGRERAYAYYAAMWFSLGYVEVELLVPATQQARVLIEVYA